MADNTTLNTGSGGDTIRTEDRTTYKTPVSLIDVGGTSSESIIGDSGVAMPVRGLAAHDAAVSGNPLLVGAEFDDTTPDGVDEGDIGRLRISSNRNLYVQIRDNAGNERGLNVDASGQITEANSASIKTAVEIMDDWDESDRAKVNPIVGQAGVAAGSGVVGTTTQRVVLATDVALPAGTNAIGKLAANSGVDIGDVDVTSIAAGDNNIGNVDIVTVPADPFGANADAAATAGSTGSIQAKLRLMTSQLDAIKTAVETLDNAISGSEMQVDLVSAAVTNAGTFAVQVDGAALTALQLIDNPVLVDDAGFTPATSSVMMAGFEADESSTDSVDEGDAGAARMTLDRKVIVTPLPHTAGGLSVFKSTDIDETEEDVKTSAGQIYAIYCVNTNASARYLKVYNATAANVTVGSTATVMDMLVPPSNSGFYVQFPSGVAFSTAICVAATTGVGDADSGAPGANEVQVHVFYK